MDDAAEVHEAVQASSRRRRVWPERDLNQEAHPPSSIYSRQLGLAMLWLPCAIRKVGIDDASKHPKVFLVVGLGIPIPMIVPTSVQLFCRLSCHIPYLRVSATRCRRGVHTSGRTSNGRRSGGLCVQSRIPAAPSQVAELLGQPFREYCHE